MHATRIVICAALALGLGLGLGCGSSRRATEARADGRHPQPDQAAAACVDALRTVADVEPSQARVVIAQGCAPLYREPACQQAWRDGLVGPIDRFAPTVVQACRDAYCPLLPEPRPSACAGPAAITDRAALATAWGSLQQAILRFEIGAARTDRLAREMAPAFERVAASTAARLERQVPLAAPGAVAAPGGPCAASIEALVTLDGVWLGTTTGERRFAAHCHDALDVAATTAELARLRGLDGLACATGATIVAEASVPYQTVVTAMDAIGAAGLPEVAFGAPADLRVGFPARPAAADLLPARCGSPAVASPAAATDDDPFATPGKDVLAGAPVVVVTPTEILLGGKAVARVVDVAGAEGDRIAGLATALAAVRAARPAGTRASDTTLVIQADHATPSQVVQRIIATATAAGYADVLFAVRGAAPPARAR